MFHGQKEKIKSALLDGGHQSSWIKSVQQKNRHLIQLCTSLNHSMVFENAEIETSHSEKCMHYRICPGTEIAMVVGCNINQFFSQVPFW